MTAAEHLDGDAEFACCGASTLDRPFRAMSLRPQVLDGGCAAASSGVIGVLGMDRHDTLKRAGVDVVAPQYGLSSANRLWQYLFQPVPAAGPGGCLAVGAWRESQPNGPLGPAVAPLAGLPVAGGAPSLPPVA